MTERLLQKYTSYLLIAFTLAVILLSAVVYRYPVLTIDVGISQGLQEGFDAPLARAFAIYAARAISFWGIPMVAVWLVLIVSFLFWRARYYLENLFCMLTLTAPAINTLIKYLINRPRPTTEFVSIFDYQLSPSFPSGHVVFYTTFFGYLIFTMAYTDRLPRWLRTTIIVISVLMIATVSFSRLYLGVHWLTDVIAGYLLGFSILLILMYFYLRMKKSR
ncbi:MAG: undecaprenyl pyrophosphate phosphatase [bacterium ADurb.Bin400]|nr:MAG: undecaprenyl pyrophosphate phosphatase [bacterium ADurb.Bin400]